MLRPMDSLSLILDDMHFNGVVFTHTDMTAPWCWHLATPGLACFHIVTQGQAWLMREHEPPLLIESGDFVVLPAGTAHTVQDKPQSTAPALDLLTYMDQSELTPVRQQGGGASCQLISGHARFDIDMAAPLISALPPVMVVRSGGSAPPLWLALGIQFLEQEIAAVRPAQQAILNRVGDVLLMECLRDHVESVPEGSGTWLAALKDKALSNALAHMHQHPARNWTVPELARQACLSRSAFAERFAQTLGEPPLTYLTRHRMRLAARHLRVTFWPISKIAHEVGYTSEAAFSQAFKREYGEAPSVWRSRNQVAS
ncbi:MAG: AraC family transcriptional regulator [Burkholderiales bacterium]|nr:AraC family transcriptional regulator [Burkholderiales bacterium]